jgi:hypothetical protein
VRQGMVADQEKHEPWDYIVKFWPRFGFLLR